MIGLCRDLLRGNDGSASGETSYGTPKWERPSYWRAVFVGAAAQTRTGDTRIMSSVLYQLSYGGGLLPG